MIRLSKALVLSAALAGALSLPALATDYQPEERIPVGSEVFNTLQVPVRAPAPPKSASLEDDRTVASTQTPTTSPSLGEGLGPDLDDGLDLTGP